MKMAVGKNFSVFLEKFLQKKSFPTNLGFGFVHQIFGIFPNPIPTSDLGFESKSKSQKSDLNPFLQIPNPNL